MRKRTTELRIHLLTFAALAAGSASACREQKQPAPDTEPVSPVAAPTSRPEQPTPEPGSTRIVYPGAPGSFVQLSETVERSVVSIQSTRKVVGGPADDFGVNEEFALGTGFIVDATGYILTNDHVIANATELVVVLSDGSKRAAQVKGRDPKLDVALLNIDGASRLTALPLGDSDKAERGEWVVAAGNAFGLGLSVSAGIVSSPQDQSGQALMDKSFYRAYLHTDANINSGNSGGPLLNMAGEVIGINVAVERNAARVGYAIPINRVKAILPQLETDGVVTRAWLGAWVKPVTADVARQVDLATPAGALVTGTVKGSPAERAGIAKGDVILEYDGRTVDDRSLPWVVATTGIGRRVPISVWRSRATIALEVITEKMPD